MKLRFLLKSICAGECSSSSLSFCSWPDSTPRRTQAGQGVHNRSRHLGEKPMSPFSNSPQCLSLSLPYAIPHQVWISPLRKLSLHCLPVIPPGDSLLVWGSAPQRVWTVRPVPAESEPLLKQQRREAPRLGRTHSCHIDVPPRSTPCSRGSPGTASPQRPPAAGTPSLGGGPRSASKTGGGVRGDGT